MLGSVMRKNMATVESHKFIPGKVSQSRTGLSLKSAKLRLVDAKKPSWSDQNVFRFQLFKYEHVVTHKTGQNDNLA